MNERFNLYKAGDTQVALRVCIKFASLSLAVTLSEENLSVKGFRSRTRPKASAKRGLSAGGVFIWIDRDDVYSLIGGIVFMPISLVYAKEIGERKRTKGVPLDPLCRSRFQTRAGINTIIKLTLACQKSDKRAVGWYSEYCLGLRVISTDSLA